MKRKILITSVIVLSFILNIYLLISNDFPARIYNKFFLNASPPQNYPTFWMDRNNTFNNELITKESIVFLGDSQIQLFENDAYFPTYHTINRGIISDNIQGLMNRINPILEKNPKKIILQIGTNDLKNLTVNQISLEYKELLTMIQSKNIDVIVTAIFPLLENNYLTLRERQLQKCNDLNLKIIEVNKRILDYCIVHNIKFVNINPEFYNNKSGLAHFLNNDGLHLNKKGYQLWASALSKEI
jgi:lysophospholipase L1-like esterase